MLKSPIKIPLLLILFSLNTMNLTAQKIDSLKFWAACKDQFPVSITYSKPRKSISEIFQYWERKPYQDLRWLAYILATAYRETAGKMEPVREGLCKTDQCAIDRVTSYFKQGKISVNYAIPDSNGRSYFGRGFVQLTHKKNYLYIGQSLGWGNTLADNPDLALDWDKALIILVEGSVKGLFTNRKLSDFFNDTTTNWIGARKIISPGSRRAAITAGYAEKFYYCLKHANN